MKGCGQAGAAAADHHQIGVDVALQRRMIRGWISRRDIVGFPDAQAGIETHHQTLSSRWSRSQW